MAEAKVSAAMMMKGMQREIASLKTQLVVAPANSPALTATAAAINAPILASIAMREKAITAIVAGEAAERLAIVKAEQLAMLTTVATSGLAGGALGARGGHGGGLSGIMRESLVIMRELGRGNLTRVPGSVLLLAQYLGILGVVVKSTAAASLLAAAAEEKLAGSMARAALVAEAKAATSLQATTAVGADVAATEALALADMESADAARLAAVAQVKKAEAAGAAAAIQKAGAVTTIAPIGWLAAAVIALGSAIFFTVRAVREYTREQKNAADIISTTTTKFSDEAEAIKKATSAAMEFEKWLTKLNEKHGTLAEKSDEATAAIKRLTDANGKLMDLQKQGKELDIDLAEKSGKISSSEAAHQKTDLDKKAIKEKSDFEIAAQKKVLDQLAADSANAIKQAGIDETAAQAASDELNKNPESRKRMAQLTAAQRKQSEAEQVASELEKNLGKGSNASPFSPPITSKTNQRITVGGKEYYGSLDYWKSIALSKQSDVTEAQNAMSTAEISTATKQQRAEQSSTSADQIGKLFDKAFGEYNDMVRNAPAIIAAEQSNIDKREKLDALGNRGEHGRSGVQLSERERAGAQMHGSEAVWIDVQKQHLQVARHTLSEIKKMTQPHPARRSPWGGYH